MRNRLFIILLVLLSLLYHPACLYEEYDEYEIVLGDRFQRSKNYDVVVADVTGDGFENLIHHQGNGNSGSYAYTPTSRIIARHQLGFKALDQINLHEIGKLTVRHDVEREDFLYGLVYEQDFKIQWEEFTLTGEKVRTVLLTELHDNHEDGIWNGEIHDTIVTDLNGDGSDDIIFSYSANYDKVPREVVAWDVLNDVELWRYAHGGRMHSYSMGNNLDIDADGRDELIFGTLSSSNGVDVNGISDAEGHLICLDDNGDLLNHIAFPYKFSRPSIIGIVDFDQDNEMEILTYLANGDPDNYRSQGFYLINLLTFEIEKFVQISTNYTAKFWLGDTDQNGSYEIIGVNAEDELQVLDSDFQVTKTAKMQDSCRQFVGSIPWKGASELMFFRSGSVLSAYDTDLNHIASKDINGIDLVGLTAIVELAGPKVAESTFYLWSRQHLFSSLEIKKVTRAVYFDWLTPAAIGLLLFGGIAGVFWRKKHRQVKRQQYLLRQVMQLVGESTSLSPKQINGEVPTDNLGELAEKFYLARDAVQDDQQLRIALETVENGQELMHRIKSLTMVYGNDLFVARRELQNEGNEKLLVVLDEMQAVTEKINTISQGYLELSKLSQVSKAYHDVNVLMEDLVGPYSKSYQNVDFQLKQDESLPLVDIDGETIAVAINNIVENSLKAMNFAGILTIATEPFKRMSAANGTLEYVSISFADSGCGVSPDEVGKIFDFGYSKFEDGTGLGMAITKRIIDLHGGEIKIVSEEGKGTVVTLLLPLS